MHRDHQIFWQICDDFHEILYCKMRSFSQIYQKLRDADPIGVCVKVNLTRKSKYKIKIYIVNLTSNWKTYIKIICGVSLCIMHQYSTFNQFLPKASYSWRRTKIGYSNATQDQCSKMLYHINSPFNCKDRSIIFF